MITIEEKLNSKVPGTSSLYVSFDYNKDIIEALKNSVTVANYDKKSKVWEVPVTDLASIINSVNVFDDIELKLKPDEKKHAVKDVQLSEFKTTPFPYQADGIKFGLSHDKWLLLDAPGLGKAVSLDTSVYTPTGKTTMGELKVGDFVIDKEGNPCKVLAVYDHDNLNMYRVTFTDGLTVDCCEDHLWLLSDGRVVPTKWFLENDCRKSYRRIDSKEKPYYVPLTKPIQFVHQNVPIQPYLLGVLLGDGSISKSIDITTVDEHIVNKVRENLPENLQLKKCAPISYRICQKEGQVITNRGYVWYADGVRIGSGKEVCRYLGLPTDNTNLMYKKLDEIKYSINQNSLYAGSRWSYRREAGNPLHQDLLDLGLFGCTSHTKFIPDVYKYNTVEVRMDVLRGLFDTDGYAAKDNHLDYSTVSEKLCDDVREIVESLGGICHKHVGQAKYNGKCTGLSYSLTIRVADPSLFVTLPRKKELLGARSNGGNPRRRFAKIEPITLKVGRCITVDSPSKTYLIEGCCVTHNTLQMLYLALELKKREGIEHCLIICGVNNLKFNWKREIEKHTKESCYILGQRITKSGKFTIGSVNDRVADLNRNIDEFFVVTNIETLRDADVVKGINKGANKFDLIIIDEVHRCKNPTAVQSKNFLKLTSSKYRVALTGTLLLNSPLDAYIPLKWIGKEHCSFSNFKYYYCNYTGFFNNDFVGYRNVDTLKEQLNECSLRRTKDLLDLPEKTIITQLVEMNPTQETFYSNIQAGIVDQVDKVDMSTANILSMVARLRQATECPSVLTTENIKSEKVSVAEDLVEQIVSGDEKVVVFSTFKDTLNTLNEDLKQYKPLLCTGDVPDVIINENIEKFQNDNEHMVMLCTTSKMGTGVTLNRATHAIFVSNPWTAADCQQCEDRIHRIGSKKPVFIHYLISNNTIDQRVDELVHDKGAISDYIIDDKIEERSIDSLRKYIQGLTV